MSINVLCHEVSFLDEQYPAALIPLTFEHLAPHVRSAILHTNHAFSDTRVTLAQHLLSWLDEIRREVHPAVS